MYLKYIHLILPIIIIFTILSRNIVTGVIIGIATSAAFGPFMF